MLRAAGSRSLSIWSSCSALPEPERPGPLEGGGLCSCLWVSVVARLFESLPLSCLDRSKPPWKAKHKLTPWQIIPPPPEDLEGCANLAPTPKQKDSSENGGLSTSVVPVQLQPCRAAPVVRLQVTTSQECRRVVSTSLLLAIRPSGAGTVSFLRHLGKGPLAVHVPALSLLHGRELCRGCRTRPGGFDKPDDSSCCLPFYPFGS